MALYWVDGNHDDHAAIAEAPLVDGVHPITERIVHLPRGFRWTWHRRVWLAAGGAVSIDRNSRIPTRSWWAEEVISDADVAACIAGGPADVVVAHDCPAGAPTVEALAGDPVWNLPPDIEADSAANRRRMRTIVDAVRPRVVYHGHYHVSYRERLPLTGGTDVEVVGLDLRWHVARRQPPRPAEAFTPMTPVSRAHDTTRHIRPRRYGVCGQGGRP